MKVCPKCGSTTSDDTQSFCLMDGIRLVPSESQPTVVMPPTTSTQTTVFPARKKTRTGLWVTLGVLIVLIGGGGIAGLMYYAYKLGSQSVVVNANVTTSPTPRMTPKSPAPKSTPTAEPSQTTAANKEPEPTSDEATPITWTTNASTFKTDVGLTYTFECPAGGTPGIVWGSDVYTADSSICTAAVHAGKITLEDGGVVTIEFKAGRPTYGATTRNGITSYNYGEYPRSMVFK